MLIVVREFAFRFVDFWFFFEFSFEEFKLIVVLVVGFFRF